MQAIDRLGWTAGISFTIYGLRVGIRVNDLTALDRVRRLLPSGWRPSTDAVVERLYSLYVAPSSKSPRTRRFHLLYEDIAGITRTLDPEKLFESLETELRVYVAEFARRRVFIHAGVVGWRGRAILIPGRSFAGKTTLVAELVRAGADYYSDEYAVLDERGRVHPFLKPLSMRAGGSEQTDVTVESLGGNAGSWPLPVGLVVACRYKAGALWRPRLLSPGQGALELLANAVAVRRMPARTLRVLEQAVRSASVLKGLRGEAAAVAPAILEALP